MDRQDTSTPFFDFSAVQRERQDAELASVSGGAQQPPDQQDQQQLAQNQQQDPQQQAQSLQQRDQQQGQQQPLLNQQNQQALHQQGQQEEQAGAVVPFGQEAPDELLEGPVTSYGPDGERIVTFNGYVLTPAQIEMLEEAERDADRRAALKADRIAAAVRVQLARNETMNQVRHHEVGYVLGHMQSTMEASFAHLNERLDQVERKTLPSGGFGEEAKPENVVLMDSGMLGRPVDEKNPYAKAVHTINEDNTYAVGVGNEAGAKELIESFTQRRENEGKSGHFIVHVQGLEDSEEYLEGGRFSQQFENKLRGSLNHSGARFSRIDADAAKRRELCAGAHKDTAPDYNRSGSGRGIAAPPTQQLITAGPSRGRVSKPGSDNRGGGRSRGGRGRGGRGRGRGDGGRGRGGRGRGNRGAGRGGAGRGGIARGGIARGGGVAGAAGGAGAGVAGDAGVAGVAGAAGVAGDAGAAVVPRGELQQSVHYQPPSTEINLGSLAEALPAHPDAMEEEVLLDYSDME